MNFYQQFIFPRLLDVAMQGDPFARYRRSLLAEVSGDVLEIGFGTGLNLPHYPQSLERIVTVDPNAGMNSLAQKRIEASGVAVDQRLLGGEALPMADQSFDSVVSTWTLCSIPEVEQALGEIWRVLRPGGKFFFIEHGLATDSPGRQRWQNRINPIQNIVGDGCNLNRDMASLVRDVFPDTAVDQFYMERLPKLVGYMYRGVATK